MTNPVATYRLQFHKHFSFNDFQKQIPYLQKLGVTTIYASPIFEATPGSVHGYDGVNPNRINPEIGTEEQLRDLSKQLKEQGMKWLQDIVPNHMAFHANNEWLMDLLENGPQSKYVAFFDVSWNSKLYHGRIMVPFLGSTLEETINNNELTIVYQNQRLLLKNFDNLYPLQLKSYTTILQSIEGAPDAIKQLLQHTPKTEDEQLHSQASNEFRLQLASLMKNGVVKSYVEKCLDVVSKNHQQLQQICDEQSYRLCKWDETDSKINYRRFFTVNSLICLNIHVKEVFEEYHKCIKQLVDDSVFQGLRIDHIDGLFDPTKYLQQLRNLVGDETFITIEKILEPGETLQAKWPIQGNTGYDFLSMVNNLFTYKKSEQQFTNYYKKLRNLQKSIPELLHEKKSFILYNHMGGELENLYQLLMQTNLVQKEDYAQMRTEDIKTAIAEFLIQCPVYRYYANAFPLNKSEAAEVQDILNSVTKNRSNLTPAIKLLENILINKPTEGNEEFNTNALRFYQRCMQSTGPLMAKGVEDTLMYTYNRFIGHNEVGDSPESFGYNSVNDFHQLMKDRQEQWPLSINATSTHDTKRGEDVRARLNVLTDVPEEWFSKVNEWRQINASLKKDGAPDNNDEYFIYQTLTGAYPMPGQDDDDIQNRMEEFVEKALREEKRQSNWARPNTKYEEATKSFSKSLLNPDGPFWKSFHGFQEKIADYGMVNSLAQVLLKFTCPGVPDVYQGTELWDLSLVDPDNRRSVDYERRQQYLDTLEASSAEQQLAICTELWNDRYTAQIKLWLTHKLFLERKNNVDLFAKGEYIPLQVEGTYKDNVFAFARKHNYDWLVVVVPLHIAQLCKEQSKNILQLDWKDTRLILPGTAPKDWQNILVQNKGKQEHGTAVKNLFEHLPFAILELQSAYTRSAGILMHITSLPSAFGIGDMGPESFSFADFLHRTHQKYWQLLPLNPTEEGQAHSPYSSLSSKAGNTLLISPEVLVQEGLLTEADITAHHLHVENKVNYSEATRIKDELFEKAWVNYNLGKFKELHNELQEFCETESKWLNDFALFMVLKQKHENKPWFEWPEEYKLRNKKAIEQITIENADELKKIKWLQFIFIKQWKELRGYCNNHGIQLFGDMPFYISYDSADVWSYREIFALDEEGKMTGVAGTPPDDFSADGQLWGMPVFKWDELKKRNYDWWIERFRKNIELFDIVRLDHFRAFADYWHVPATDKTAINGHWRPGPGADLFITAQKELGSLPFIAEDLGDINDAVYELRDQFNLPGMKVLQFTFGHDVDSSVHSPHNYNENAIVYTGTHDNNTTKGWYRHEAHDKRHRLEQYVGRSLNENEAVYEMGKLAFASVAKTAIIPMQDVLALDESARMNIPSSSQNNWAWRLEPYQLTTDAENLLNEWTGLYKRR